MPRLKQSYVSASRKPGVDARDLASHIPCGESAGAAILARGEGGGQPPPHPPRFIREIVNLVPRGCSRG